MSGALVPAVIVGQQDGRRLGRLAIVLKEQERAAHGDAVAGMKVPLAYGNAVDESAMEALQVAQLPAGAGRLDEAVVPRDREVAQVEAVRAVAADGHGFPLQGEGTPGQRAGEGEEAHGQVPISLDRVYPIPSWTLSPLQGVKLLISVVYASCRTGHRICSSGGSVDTRR